MSNKSIKKTVFVIAMVFIMGFSFALGYLTYYITIPGRAKKLMQVADLLDKYYVDITYNAETGKYEYANYNDEDYARALAEAMTDVYSGYYSNEEYAEYISDANGYQVGIGVTFLNTQINDLIIYKTIGNSPLQRAGVKAGDKIIKIVYNGVTTFFSDYEYQTRYNTFVSVLQSIPLSQPFDIYIDGVTDPFTVSKEQYIESYFEYKDNEYSAFFRSEDYATQNGQPKLPEMKTVAGGIPLLANDTAYMSFTAFEGNAYSEFVSLMAYMKQRNKTKLILDLRNNGGGQVSIMGEIASYLVNDESGVENILIANVVDKQGNRVSYFTSQNNYKDYPIEIVVLANEHTASASEMLIGAMISSGTLNKDRLIITKNVSGVAKTYGKGIMQSMFMPTDMSFVLKLTSAVVYWPNGECIHGKGIYTTAENSVADIDNKDSQLERAIALLAG